MFSTYNLTHYSVGDNLRNWMHKNHSTPLAATIRDNLENQGFLTSQELNPFICRAIKSAISQKPAKSGILIDGFPRNLEQLNSGSVRPFAENLLISGASKVNAKPDVVIALRVSKQNAKVRYLARARDSNDSDEKFERRFTEYEVETVPVEDDYRRRGILIDVDMNGTKEENIRKIKKRLINSDAWQRIMVKEGANTDS
ncbi:adenylate kinase [Pyrenophora seminiperda CCB06]|uniref:Adenylate kinase n=1 Tax=Pyrenophora seminiperda CCB06 TaxID=1302712 RepID=A0A3M7M042_9PLEO|nr:adenylate kinase [Pyrenophora seminiperda CCB06]